MAGHQTGLLITGLSMFSFQRQCQLGKVHHRSFLWIDMEAMQTLTFAGFAKLTLYTLSSFQLIHLMFYNLLISLISLFSSRSIGRRLQSSLTPVKKHHFIQCYNSVRKLVFTKHYIRNGWKAAGLYPWNLEKTLNLSQVKRFTTAHTPSPETNEPVVSTPKKPHQLYSAVQHLQRNHQLSREDQAIFAKISKAIHQLNAEKAKAEVTIQHQQAQLEACSLKGKYSRKVYKDPNTKFLRIDNIVKAWSKAAEHASKLAAKKPEQEARQLAAQMQASDMGSFLTSWQLEL